MRQPLRDAPCVDVSVDAERTSACATAIGAFCKATTGRFGDPGKAGLWTVADSVTYFDDFRVDPKQQYHLCASNISRCDV